MQGKKILLGLTGGVAAYKAAELCRLFVKAGADVQVLMTAGATQFITPVTLQALSGNPVYSDMWDARIGNNMAHIELSRDRDLILVAPASADFMAKVASGLADDLLSTLCLARECPLFLAPAMNRQMWENTATQRNVTQLRADGVVLLGPDSGDQACGETGMGRMIEPERLFDDIAAVFSAHSLSGKNVLITAGPTFEAIDAVRGITNRSSGKMGFAVAQAALEAGARVTLVSGPTPLATPAGAHRIDVVSARDMHQTVMPLAAKTDVFIAVAAVADYAVVNASKTKWKKTQGAPQIELVENPDILAEVAALPTAPFCVGFAAETENLVEHAQAKRKKKNIPLLAANLAQHAFGEDENELHLFHDQGETLIPRGPKLQVARELIREIAARVTR